MPITARVGPGAARVREGVDAARPADRRHRWAADRGHRDAALAERGARAPQARDSDGAHHRERRGRRVGASEAAGSRAPRARRAVRAHRGERGDGGAAYCARRVSLQARAPPRSRRARGRGRAVATGAERRRAARAAGEIAAAARRVDATRARRPPPLGADAAALLRARRRRARGSRRRLRSRRAADRDRSGADGAGPPRRELRVLQHAGDGESGERGARDPRDGRHAERRPLDDRFRPERGGSRPPGFSTTSARSCSTRRCRMCSSTS